MAIKNVKKRREATERARASTSEKAAEQLASAEAALADAEKLEQEARDAFNSTTEALRTELVRVDAERVQDTRKLLFELVTRAVDHEVEQLNRMQLLQNALK